MMKKKGITGNKGKERPRKSKSKVGDKRGGTGLGLMFDIGKLATMWFRGGGGGCVLVGVFGGVCVVWGVLGFGLGRGGV